jgi:hypothetical protein
MDKIKSYTRKNAVVYACRWMASGDCPDVVDFQVSTCDCGEPHKPHGKLFLETYEKIVCPGNYILKTEYGPEAWDATEFEATFKELL